MANIKHLTKLANRFYTQAQAVVNLQLEQYIDRMVRNMLGLSRGAEVSIKHLLSMPKYSASQTLKDMSGLIPQLTTALSEVSASDAGGLSNVENILGSLSFYTSSGNAGTGYDAVTSVSEGGYSPPAYYVKTLTNMLDQVKGKVSQQPKEAPVSDNGINT
jgi:hypothetical protein